MKPIYASVLRDRRKQARKAALFSILLFFCSLWIAFDTFAAPFATDGTVVTVPDFCGSFPDELTFAEWMDVRIEYITGEDGAEGRVIAQTPAAGSIRKLSPRRWRCSIVLSVCKGRATLSVPDLRGSDVHQACDRLRRMGLSAVVRSFPGERPEGEVYATDPIAGQTVSPGDVIELSVSAGMPPEDVRVPNLVGMTRSEALIALWRAGLGAASVIEEDAPSAESGRVIRQSHESGTSVPAKTGIVLYVAKQRDE